jgi:hypothetical protein
MIKKKVMKTIVIKPKSKAESDFLTQLLKKMNIESDLVEELEPNELTKAAMEDTNRKKGIKVENSNES